jgi:hypothetical protein
MIVHVPIGLAVAIAVAAPAVLIMWTRGILPRRAWWLAALLQTVLVAGAVAAVQTGELAERTARRSVGSELVDQHEDMGTAFSVLAGGGLLLFLGAAVLSDEKRARQLAMAAVVLAEVQLAGAVVASHAGGLLVWGPDGLLKAETADATPTPNRAD